MMYRRGLLLAAPALLGGCSWIERVFAPRPDPFEVSRMQGFVTSQDRIIYVGDVLPGADAALDALVARAPEVKTLELDMVAGAQGSEAGMALGRAVRSAGLRTEVRQGSTITGAGTDVFVAGDPRIIEDGATLAWRGHDMARAPEYARYLEEMTGTAAISTFLDEEAPRLRARPLTVLDIQRLALATDGITGAFTDIGREI